MFQRREGRRTQRKNIVLSFSAFLCIFIVSGCSGLGGEPRIVATIPPPTATTQPRPPSLQPDIAIGAGIFAARCATCHGGGGAGDGELVASGQVPVMASFTNAATARGQRPTQWYGTITNGRIENLMPPWADALSESERWAVALYSYTLQYDLEMLTLGRTVYGDFCASCHGDSGRGDGVDAPTLREHPGDLTDPEAMMILSDNHMYVAVNEGAGEMPAFADDLSEEEQRAVVAYTRTLALANADAVGVIDTGAQSTGAQVPPPVATAEIGTANDAETTPELARIGTITGRIANGTAGGTLPAALDVLVYRLDADFARTQFETTTDAAGAYRIDGVPLDPASNYVAAVTYRERVFASAVSVGDGDALDLPVTIYELTEDPAIIEITGMVTQINAVGSNLEIAQVLTMRNTSDRAFSSSQTTDDGRPISVVISLPPGAVVAGMVDPTRYVVAEEEYLVLDTFPVMPREEHVVQLVYIIPYDAGGAIIEQTLNYALTGPVRVLLSPDSVRATSDQLSALGDETIGNRVVQSYGGSLNLPAGASLRYDISGAPQSVAAADRGVESVAVDNLPLIILLIAGAQVVILGGLYVIFARRRSRKPALTAAQLMDALIRQIAELDAEYEARKVEKSVYERQRALLKERLAAVMERDRTED
ncbi:MAG: c-type cytochrome [Chloroflexota bacterium]|nr:c-type cytochrome [Chloroflexota bacterium]